MTTPPAPFPAATVIIGRPLPAAFEVLLVKRHGKSGFMGGVHVFPGGRVDATDGDPGSEAAFARAAARETREEAGLTVDVDALRPFAWWITPEAEPKRFDTRFFLVEVPADAQAVIDEHEAVAFYWLTPRAALSACAEGRIRLAPPTLCVLEDLAPFATVAAAAAAVRLPLQPICPRIVEQQGEDGATLVFALPGDALHDEREAAFSHRTRVVRDRAGRLSSARVPRG